MCVSLSSVLMVLHMPPTLLLCFLKKSFTSPSMDLVRCCISLFNKLFSLLGASISTFSVKLALAL